MANITHSAQTSLERTTEAILGAADYWKKKCWLEDGSLFQAEPLWTKESTSEFYQVYSTNLLAGDQSFWEKFEIQMKRGSPAIGKLAAEMLWVMYLYPTGYKPDTKRSNIRKVWEWSGEKFTDASNLVSNDILNGIGKAGTYFMTNFWQEILYFSNLAQSFKSFDQHERTTMMSEPWQFGEWVDQVRQDARPQFRHVFCWLMFPDHYEWMASNSPKRRIIQAFRGLSTKQIESLSGVDRDKLVLDIRNEIQAKEGIKRLNFYDPAIRHRWDSVQREPRVWIEKTLVNRRSDRMEGNNALGKALWSPQKADDGRNIYKEMEEVNAGDVVLHLVDNEAFAGVSVAESRFGNDFVGIGGTPWEGRACYRIPLTEYQKLKSPLLRQTFLDAPEVKNELLEIRNNNRGLFYNKKLDLNQGSYLTEAPLPLVRLLDKLYLQQTAEHLPHLPDEFTWNDLEEPSHSRHANEAVHESSPDGSHPYTSADALNGLFMSPDEFAVVVDRLRRKKAIILQGPPGVGKTFIARRLAYTLMREYDDRRVAMVQFHPSYGYEDFVQGYRPTPSGLERRNGILYQFVQRAQNEPNKDWFFIIDEINRGNLAKIFGELLMLIEADKRGPAYAIPLTYSDTLEETFQLPPNVYFIGTMNTADRSLAMVDYALRRRFAFVSLIPAFKSTAFADWLLGRNASESLITLIRDRLSRLNDTIEKERDLGVGFCVGHSFFCPPDDRTPDDSWYREVIDAEIRPLLDEYFDSPERVNKLVEELLAK